MNEELERSKLWVEKVEVPRVVQAQREGVSPQTVLNYHLKINNV